MKIRNFSLAGLCFVLLIMLAACEFAQNSSMSDAQTIIYALKDFNKQILYLNVSTGYFNRKGDPVIYDSFPQLTKSYVTHIILYKTNEDLLRIVTLDDTPRIINIYSFDSSNNLVNYESFVVNQHPTEKKLIEEK